MVSAFHQAKQKSSTLLRTRATLSQTRSPEDKRLRIFPPTTRYSESEKGDNLPHLCDSNRFPMPTDPPIAEEQPEIVPSEHLQLLLGCLILGFVLCGSMVLYTNHVKGALTALAQVP